MENELVRETVDKCPTCGSPGKFVAHPNMAAYDFDCERCGKITTATRPQLEIAAAKRLARKLERQRLRGVFIPSTVEKSRKQRRAEAAEKRKRNVRL